MKKEFIILIIFLSTQTYSQTFHISGNVSTGTVPVSYASITFTDENDISKSFSAITDTSGNYQVDVITNVKDEPIIPQTIELEQNYPNPFSSETEIQYKLEKHSDVVIKIYNILGQEVRRFDVGLQRNGIYGIRWDGRNNLGNKVSPGIYLYQLVTDDETLVKKMVFTGGGTNPLNASFFSNSVLKAKKSENKTKTLESKGTYRCQIKNNDNTCPRMLAREIREIQIDGDTTINITVIKESTAEGYFPLQIGNEWTLEFPYWTPSSGDTTGINNCKIVTSKILNGRKYYGFDNEMPFFPYDHFLQELIGADIDTIFIRQNEEGDIMLLVDSSEYQYFTFDASLIDSLVRTKVKNADYFLFIESINETVNTPMGSFDKCFKILNYYPAIKGTEYYSWFAPGYGPVKIYYPELGVTYQLGKINIQNN